MKQQSASLIASYPWSGRVLLLAVVISLNSCGFISAPLTHSSAWVAGTTVKAAEAGRQQSVRAASYIRTKAFSTGNAPGQSESGPRRH